MCIRDRKKPMPSTKSHTPQIISRQRVADHGEAFTAESEVKAMCDLVKNETERIESRFLEPACGDVYKRQVLVEISNFESGKMECIRQKCEVSVLLVIVKSHKSQPLSKLLLCVHIREFNNGIRKDVYKRQAYELAGTKFNHNKIVKIIKFLTNKRMVVQESRGIYRFMPDYHY